MYKEGKWTRVGRHQGNDSQALDIRHSNNNKYANIDRISLGTVLFPQPEPLYKQHAVAVRLVTGGTHTNVAWPGAQVNANATGIVPGGVAIGIHGLWESPLAGQQVLLGYVDGSAGNPIVINKYPYNALQRPDIESMHYLPITFQAHGATDVVLGHHTGSFVALRGTLPLPAQIDIVSLSAITIQAVALLSITTPGAITISGATMSITSAATILITASPNVIVNAGVRAVAAQGDTTPTLLGASPILATGTSILVP